VEAKTWRLGHRIERGSENRLHKVRKMLKTLRDGVEDLGTLYGAKEAKRYCLACEAVQSVLGAVNDAIAADALVAKLSFGDDAGLVPGIDLFSEWTSRRRDAAMARLPEAWAGFRGEKAFWH
jgi:triphosphatase